MRLLRRAAPTVHNDRHRVAANWLQAARNDREAAEYLADRLPSAACFHCQQSAEKAFKSVLVKISGDAPRSHLFEVLLAEFTDLKEAVPLDLARAARLLEKYYLSTRYPDALDGADITFAFSTAEANSALANVDAILIWAQEKLNA